MPVLNTPITTDDRNLKKVLGQKQPAIVVLYDGNQNDKPLQDALKGEAKKHAGELLVVRVDVSENPGTLAKYNDPETPALVTLTQAFFGRKVKSSAEGVRPSDIRAHIKHLLNDTPLPEPNTKNGVSKQGRSQKKAAHVTQSTFRKEVLKSKVPVLVDFWADWCGPCHAVAPFVDELAHKYKGKAKVVKVNVDQNQAISQQFMIQSIPTFIVFDGGQPVGRLTGGNPRGIQNLLDDALRGR